MAALKLFFCVLLATAVVSSAPTVTKLPTITRLQDIKVSIAENKKLVKAHNCSLPHNVLLLSSQLFTRPVLAVYPVSFLVQKCGDQSGCCKKREKYQPTVMQVERRAFRVRENAAGGRKEKREFKLVEKHLKCGCL